MTLEYTDRHGPLTSLGNTDHNLLGMAALPSSTSYFIITGWSSMICLCEFMLTTFEHPLVFHVPRNDFQHYLFLCLSRDGSKVDQTVLPWVLLFSLFVERTDNNKGKENMSIR